MYRKQLFLLVALFVSSLLFAQNKSANDDFTIGKYTIKILKNADDTYGYAIYNDNNLLVSQNSKPFSTTPRGFKNVGNIRVIAKWHTDQLDKGQKNPAFMPYGEAIKLGITKDDL
jgi:hypothetical protein